MSYQCKVCMKQRVLIIGPAFFGYNHSIKRAFDALGYESEVLQYDGLIHPFNWTNAVLNKVSPSNKWLKEKCKRNFNRLAIEVFQSFSPDLVFIYNGDILTSASITQFKERSKVVVWLLDGAGLHPDSIALAPLVDAYFCFERTDIELVKKLNRETYFLPQAYDPEIYYPIADCKKEIDVLFVGNLYFYPNRVRLLKSLAKQLKGKYTFKVYGVYKPIYKNPIKWLFREGRSVFLNKNISPKEVNRLYNRSKLCLNIHHDQTREGANPKVFEICGSGAFQVVDSNPFIAETFPDGSIARYESDEECIEQILRLLHSDVAVQATEAYHTVAEKHTFTARIKEVLEIIKI